MKTIEYRVNFNEGESIYVRVRARDINAGFRKATAAALRLPGEIHSVEFWQVTDVPRIPRRAS